MIKADMGDITIRGSGSQLLAEFSCLATALMNALASDYGEALAEVRIRHAFKLAFPCPTSSPDNRKTEPDEKPKPDKLALTKEQKAALLDLVREVFGEGEKDEQRM